jgi:hypothetical protein
LSIGEIGIFFLFTYMSFLWIKYINPLSYLFINLFSSLFIAIVMFAELF